MLTGSEKSFILQLFFTAVALTKLSGEHTEVGSCCLLLTDLLSSAASQLVVTSWISLYKRRKFLWAQGLHTHLDKLHEFTSVRPMFWHISTNTSPRLPSRFDSLNRYLVDIQPDFLDSYIDGNNHSLCLQLPSEFPWHPQRSWERFFVVWKFPHETSCPACLDLSCFLLVGYFILGMWRVDFELSTLEGWNSKFKSFHAGSLFAALPVSQFCRCKQASIYSEVISSDGSHVCFLVIWNHSNKTKIIHHVLCGKILSDFYSIFSRLPCPRIFLPQHFATTFWRHLGGFVILGKLGNICLQNQQSV